MKYRRGNIILFLLFAIAVAGLIAIVAFNKYDFTKSVGDSSTEDADAQVKRLNIYSQSDEVDAIESDLEESDLDAINEELSQLDGELESI